jgi:hypothetical protein
MPYKDRRKQREFNRRWMAADRARKREHRVAELMQWYREQAANPTQPTLGQTPEQHRYWCSYVLSLPSLEDFAATLPDARDLLT